MQKLKEIVANPSGWDSLANYMGELPAADWLCLLTRSRDSSILTESNWESALADLGGEGENVQIFRFGHWACGWWEALAVKEGTPEAEKAEAIERALADYPVLDESDFSEREVKAADELWRDCYRVQDRIDYIREHRSQFEFHNFADLLACVRGQYFAGYASELID